MSLVGMKDRTLIATIGDEVCPPAFLPSLLSEILNLGFSPSGHDHWTPISRNWSYRRKGKEELPSCHF